MAAKPDDDGDAAIAHLSRTALLGVFDEHDPARRAATIASLFAEDARFIDHFGVHAGRDAINAAVEHLHAQLPGFRFAITRDPQLLPGVARLAWQFGPPSEPTKITGTDTILVEDGRIALLVFLDQGQG